MRLRAPEGVNAVSLATADGPVVIEGPEADVTDPVVVHELEALGWTEAKAPARKTKPD